MDVQLGLMVQAIILFKEILSISVPEGVQVMWGSHYNTITENTILDCNDVEIRLQESDWNSVSENTVRNNGVGISIYIDNTNSIQRPKNRALHQETLALCSFLLKIIENSVMVKIKGRIVHEGNSGTITG